MNFCFMLSFYAWVFIFQAHGKRISRKSFIRRQQAIPSKEFVGKHQNCLFYLAFRVFSGSVRYNILAFSGQTSSKPITTYQFDNHFHHTTLSLYSKSRGYKTNHCYGKLASGCSFNIYVQGNAKSGSRKIGAKLQFKLNHSY